MNNFKINPMNKYQVNAIARIKRFMISDYEHCEEAPLEMHSVTIKEYHKGHFAFAGQMERLALPKGNLLRAIDHGYYHFFIGKRGAVTVKNAPSSYNQFNNKRAFGFTFKLNQ